MGKAAGHKAKEDAKRAIKDKKKYKNRNSIGKTRKKVGSAGRFMTRTSAVNKLQVSLKDFRKLCILKGIYPREPKKKFKGGNTTYFFSKDVQFLMHEPLLAKFREQKAFLKKITKALGRHEKLKARRLDGRRPVYKLDGLIRERYPTFVDALQELDDVLCLVVLFASLSPSKFVPAARVDACARLRREFLAYLARTRALRHVFISIKGIYYQAEVSGVTLTWVEPHHSFAQQPTMVVDYRVMTSFLELYEAVLTFVNFKLYHDLGLAYPPAIDAVADGAGAHLGAAVLAPKSDAAPTKAADALGASAGNGGASHASSLSSSQLASLRSKLHDVDNDTAGDDAMIVSDVGGRDGAETADFDANLSAMALSPEIATLRNLFASCVFFCGRETPVPSLEFIILSCGGRVGWEGEASPFGVDDSRITHHVIDRPHVGESADHPRRERVQPQWVYDSINARALLPTHAYWPGVKCPAHLSPFVDTGTGEEPKERVRLAVLAATRAADEAGGGDDEDDLLEGDEDQDEDPDAEDDDSDDEDDNESDGDIAHDADEALRYRKELAAEAAGKSYADSAAADLIKRKRQNTANDDGKVSEDKALAMMMMSRKKRRLYDRMQYGINKKAEAEQKLQAKRDAIDAAAVKTKGAKAKKRPSSS